MNPVYFNSNNIFNKIVNTTSRFFKMSSRNAVASFFTGVTGWMVLILILLFVAEAGFAQSPDGFSYQAVVRNNAGLILPNQTVSVRFTLHGDSAGGSIYFRQTDTVLTNQLGVFTVVIGGSNLGTIGNISNIPWGSHHFFLQVETDVYGGSNFVDMGTSQLLSAPYAFYANRAGSIALNSSGTYTATGNDSINVESNAYIAIGSTVGASAAAVTLSNGVYTGQILVIEGKSTGTNGVRFENIGNINVGAATGSVDLLNESLLTLIWNGSQWIKMSYSSNQ